MTTKTIGPTGDYATWAAFRTAIGATQGDDYTIDVQDGTYNETVLIDWDPNSYTLLVRGENRAASSVVFDQQSVRSYAVDLRRGAVTFQHLEFKNSTSYVTNVTDPSGDCDLLEMFACTTRGGTQSVRSATGGVPVTLEKCHFEDPSDRHILLYTWADAVPINVLGCDLYSTAGNTPNVGAELDYGNATGVRGVIRGCRMHAANVVSGANNGVIGGPCRMEECRIIGARAEGIRRQWGTGNTVINCVVDANGVAGAYAGLNTRDGNNWKIYRCLFINYSVLNHRGIYVPAGYTNAYADVRNCGFYNCYFGIQVAAGLAGLKIDQQHCGYWNNNTDKSGPVGTFNNPETGEVLANPNLDTNSQDSACPIPGSSWEEAGVADGETVIAPSGTPTIGAVELMPVELG